jgi:segregation and condensation protein B
MEQERDPNEPEDARETDLPEPSPQGGDEPEPSGGAEEEAAASAAEQGDEPASPDTEPTRKKARKREFSPVPPERLDGAVEALLLAAGDVLSPERLRDVLGLGSVLHIREAVDRLRVRWAEAERSVEIQELAGGYRVVTCPEYAEYVRRLSRRAATDRLSASLLETLSIVAYRQPVPRVEVERIRGVQGGDALRGLLERQLIKVVGRSDQPGRPLLYGTTRRFLEVFGLGSLKDLPKKGDLKNL